MIQCFKFIKLKNLPFTVGAALKCRFRLKSGTLGSREPNSEFVNVLGWWAGGLGRGWGEQGEGGPAPVRLPPLRHCPGEGEKCSVISAHENIYWLMDLVVLTFCLFVCFIYEYKNVCGNGPTGPNFLWNIYIFFFLPIPVANSIYFMYCFF